MGEPGKSRNYVRGNGIADLCLAMMGLMNPQTLPPSTRAGKAASIGSMLREWRQRRRMSQLDLACEAEISTRHLSFVESGRSQPSREMVMHLAERLEVPLRERNLLLVACLAIGVVALITIVAAKPP